MRNKKSNNLVFPTYQKVREKIDKKTGSRPSLPKDLTKGQWSEQSLKVLEERYLFRNDRNEVVETPEDLCWRVSWEVASAEVVWGANRNLIMEKARDFYRLLTSHQFLPNSPTLMNAGTKNGLQYSGCFVVPIEDSLVGIFDAIKYQALIHQTGGGTGFSFSRLRARGSIVKSSRGVASGPISFMRVFDSATNEIKQGGKRRGANMGILRVDHPDIKEFIHCKEEGGITNFNISVGITDTFMQAYKEDGEYELINPKNKEVAGKLKAREVFEEITQVAWKTGDPGLIFLDRVNSGPSNPVPSLGPIESTNPCIVGSSLVLTTNGLIRIKDLVNGYLGGGYQKYANLVDARVIDDKSSKKLRVGEVVAFYDNGIKDVYKLTTKSGYEIIATSDHRFLTNNGFIELGKLEIGDGVYIQSAEGQFSKDKKIKGIGVNKLKHFPDVWSKELGQILGWLVGDGWLRTGDKNCRVGFTFGEDDKLLMSRFQKIINEWYGKDIQPVKRLRNTYHLSYHGKDIVNFFLSLGVLPVKAINKGVPESIFSAPKETVGGFMQGLFSADGTVRNSLKSSSDWVALTSKSLKLLKSVQIILLNFGIKSRIFDRSRKERKGILYELGIFGDFRDLFKDEIGFINLSKQYKLENVRARRKKRIKDYFNEKIISIEKCGKDRVYDITENTTHSMIANGFVIHQCGEQPLYPFDSCNLGSIFLNYLVKEENGVREFDWEKLKAVIGEAVRFLDNVIEVNPYTLEEIRQTTLSIRRIGLGVGGWADLLIALKIPYDSQEALDLAEMIMKTVQEMAVETSEKLAKDRGPFPLWNESIYKNRKPRRNATVTTIAPTGSISIIANASSGIEPLFAIAYRHIVKDEHMNREMSFINPEFIKVAQEQGFWSKEVEEEVTNLGILNHSPLIPEEVRKVFITAHEIDPVWHIRTQMAFQKYTENAVSKTINLKHDAKVEEVKQAYLLAWDLGCKGITIFRDGSKDAQVLNLGLNHIKKESDGVITDEPLIKRPFVVKGSTYRLETPVGSAFITINEGEDHMPLELFINVGKAGSDVQAMAEALGRTISTTLRLHSSLNPRERAREIAGQLAGIGGRRSVGFGPSKIRSLPDAISVALSQHYHFKVSNGHSDLEATPGMTGATVAADFSAPNGVAKSDPLAASVVPAVAANPTGDLCPSCGSGSLVYEEGCSKCHACGYSEC